MEMLSFIAKKWWSQGEEFTCNCLSLQELGMTRAGTETMAREEILKEAELVELSNQLIVCGGWDMTRMRVKMQLASLNVENY